MLNESDSCKVVLIGESGVGKTSIISQFIDQDFQTELLPTNGATFFTKEMIEETTKKEVKFEIWDTAGQEKYRSLTSMFYKDASIAVLVYDITRQESFDAIKNYWVEQIKENGPEGIILAIAANKSDLYETEKVSEETGREFANSLNAIFKLTSATNYEGVNNLFQALAYKCVSPDNLIVNEKEKEKQKQKANEENKNSKVKITVAGSGNNGEGKEGKGSKKKCC